MNVKRSIFIGLCYKSVIKSIASKGVTFGWRRSWAGIDIIPHEASARGAVAREPR